MRDVSDDVIYSMPFFDPKLKSGKNAYTICGKTTYEIVNPDPDVFNSINNIKSVGEVNPTFKAFTV